MKIVVTGGHHTTAMAVIKELEKHVPELDILWIGHKHAMKNDQALSMEFEEIAQMNFKFLDINAVRSNDFVRKPHQFIFSLSRAYLHLRKYKPDLILSFGGYISVPVCLVGKLILHVPCVIHDQVVTGGKATRLLSKIVNKTLISWPETKEYIPSGIVVGNPIRSEIKNPDKSALKSWGNRLKGSKPIILVTGGKLGSHTINMMIMQILPDLTEKYLVIHQCGETSLTDDQDKLKKLRGQLSKKQITNYFLYPRISAKDMGAILNLSDLVISRSGANTVSELASLKKVAILIPLKRSNYQEQLKNAEILEKLGSAVIVDEDSLPEQLLIEIEHVLNNKQMVINAKNITISTPNPEELIVKEILSCLA